jgi:HEAT repeat protein
MRTNFKSVLLGSLFACAASASGAASAADDHADAYSGRASVYRDLSEGSLEHLSSAESIKKAVSSPNIAPTQIWQVLEHGEKVECLSCIPYVAKILYHEDTRAREIGAWWLRRRIFGVFGPGEVYSQVVETLQDQSVPDNTRAYAAQALGEFLTGAGVKYVATAAVEDDASVVRVAAVRALERLNNQGPNSELATALSDKNEDVRLAAVHATTHINVFTNVGAVIELISDKSADVRWKAADALGAMNAQDAVVGLIALTSFENEADANVRKAAINSLGRIADPSAKSHIQAALESDPNQFVRDAAKFALRRL